MTIQQISQRGKDYFKTAETLLRAAQTMTDRAIAGQLKALADDFPRRAEKLCLGIDRDTRGRSQRFCSYNGPVGVALYDRQESVISRAEPFARRTTSSLIE
jgi:hypothetical protein